MACGVLIRRGTSGGYHDGDVVDTRPRGYGNAERLPMFGRVQVLGADEEDVRALFLAAKQSVLYGPAEPESAAVGRRTIGLDLIQLPLAQQQALDVLGETTITAATLAAIAVAR